MNAKRPEDSVREDRELPFITVTMPVRNEEAHLGAVLNQLRCQDYPHDRFEIIVADGLSTDRTKAVVERFRMECSIATRVIDNPKRLSSAGRNIGIRAARGDYVVFVDGHCEIQNPSMLRDAVHLFQSTGCDCLSRPQPLTTSGSNRFQLAVAAARASRFGHGTDSTIYDTRYEGPVNPTSSGALYRKTVFGAIGCYDETFDACEDVELNYRVFKAGMRSWISPKLAVLYQPRAGVRGLWKQMVRYGRGRFRFVSKHPEALSIGQLVPPLFVVWLVLGFLAGWFFPAVLMLSLGTAALYLACLAWFSIALGIRNGSAMIYAPVVYATIHFGLGMGFLAEACIRIVSGLQTKPFNSDGVTSGEKVGH